MARRAPSILILIAGLVLALAGGSPQLAGEALAQQTKTRKQAAKPAAGADPLAARLGQLEEQIVDLQVVTGTLQSLLKGQGQAAGQGAPTGQPDGTPLSPSLPGAGASELGGRVDVIETQIRALTGQIEQMSARLAQLEARLAAGGPAFQTAPQTTAQPRQPAVPAPGRQPAGTVTVTRAPAPAPQGVVRPGTVQTRPLPPAAPDPRPRLATASSPAARSAYEAAYGHILRRDYGAAEAGFRQFLQSHPNDANASSAQYWLGESHFHRGQFREAATAYLKGYRKNRGGSKAPDSLLKLGMSLHKLGEKDAACATLSELASKFPSAPPHVKQNAAAELRRVGC